MATAISSLITPPALHLRCRSTSSASVSVSAGLSLRAVAAPQARGRGLALRVAASSALLEAPAEVAARKLYVGNIPRTVTNDELRDMFAAHGTVERAEVTQAFLLQWFFLFLVFSWFLSFPPGFFPMNKFSLV